MKSAARLAYASSVPDPEGIRRFAGDLGLAALISYSDWQRGGMPLPGGLEAQPARWYQTVALVDATIGECERKDKERREAKAKRG